MQRRKGGTDAEGRVSTRSKFSFPCGETQGHILANIVTLTPSLLSVFLVEQKTKHSQVANATSVSAKILLCPRRGGGCREREKTSVKPLDPQNQESGGKGNRWFMTYDCGKNPLLSLTQLSSWVPASMHSSMGRVILYVSLIQGIWKAAANPPSCHPWQHR